MSGRKSDLSKYVSLDVGNYPLHATLFMCDSTQQFPVLIPYPFIPYPFIPYPSSSSCPRSSTPDANLVNVGEVRARMASVIDLARMGTLTGCTPRPGFEPLSYCSKSSNVPATLSKFLVFMSVFAESDFKKEEV